MSDVPGLEAFFSCPLVGGAGPAKKESTHLVAANAGVE
jgi:hypothetical protein